MSLIYNVPAGACRCENYRIEYTRIHTKNRQKSQKRYTVFKKPSKFSKKSTPFSKILQITGCAGYAGYAGYAPGTPLSRGIVLQNVKNRKCAPK